MAIIVKEPEERREELLSIGVRLLLQGGDKNVSVSKVIGEAGVATGLFYYYFKTKEAFLEEAHAMYHRAYVSELAKNLANKSLPVMTRLDLLVERLGARFCEVVKMYEDKPEDFTAQLGMMEGQIINSYHAVLGPFVVEGCEKGCFHTANPELSALYMVSGVMGILQRVNLVDGKEVEKELKRLIYGTLSVSTL